jgi:hypothetical protein
MPPQQAYGLLDFVDHGSISARIGQVLSWFEKSPDWREEDRSRAESGGTLVDPRDV